MCHKCSLFQLFLNSWWVIKIFLNDHIFWVRGIFKKLIFRPNFLNYHHLCPQINAYCINHHFDTWNLYTNYESLKIKLNLNSQFSNMHSIIWVSKNEWQTEHIKNETYILVWLTKNQFDVDSIAVTPSNIKIKIE